MAFYQTIPWHEGEQNLREALRVDRHDNPTVPTLSPQLANHLGIAPLIAIGTLDKEGHPWTTLWGGEAPLAQALGGGVVGIRSAVTGSHDPVVEELVGKSATGEVVREEGEGRMVSGLTIDLETRKRVKMFGRMIAGALGSREDEVTGTAESIAEVQLVLKIEQSLGNCPKYLNKKHIVPAVAKPELLSDSAQLSQKGLDILAKTDLFFVSSSQHMRDMDTNHRGGPPGFVRVVSEEASGTVICWPEYSGNRLYQTLGNLAVTPKAGICVPDFETGDMLYLTGSTEILIGHEANATLPRSNLAVKLSITSARYVANALPFRGIPGEASPYNPTVRYAATEKKTLQSQQDSQDLQQATLLRRTRLTRTISRFRFALSNAATYKPGQYVTLDFSAHLDIGYSHMRDDDPRSLNDDFVRTFTVSSSPGSPPDPVRRLKDDEFEITIRRVGVVTEFLFKHAGSEGDGGRRGNLEVGVKGFGGEFDVRQATPQERVCFTSAGIGVTPLLPSLDVLDYERLRVLWSVREEDLPLVVDVLEQHSGVGRCCEVFVTDAKEESESVRNLRELGSSVQLRRIHREDVREKHDKYYICTGLPMRRQLLEWLPAEKVIFEDFNF